MTANSCIEFASSEEHTKYYLSIRCIPSTDVGVKLKEFKPILITCISLLNSHITTECVGKVMNAENCDKTIRWYMGILSQKFKKKSWVQAPKGVFDDNINKENDDNYSTFKMTSNIVSSMHFIPAMIFTSVFMILPFFYSVQLIREIVMNSLSVDQEEVNEFNSLLSTSKNNLPNINL